ncbi:hypothetical protein M0R88_04295 [Halorussus gelatinilyticus]|uniref:Uncharacterized protein n=1 Tax=Halorussus gelatinilyticus TaxID=2937524 RepID=A0A8U0IKP4_9EURY|nr:hypothetical protein [Halorussus gelatinilyticus]UPW01328.1 hypothetical protein M0R88_04295 [Halorussus gelatinilyticus]
MLGQNLLRSGNAGVPNVSYYDLALAVLPLPLLVGLLAGEVLALPVQTGVAAGALVSALALGHLLFRDPPTRRGPRDNSDVESEGLGSKGVGGNVGKSSP